jgi:beta-lactamase class A
MGPRLLCIVGVVLVAMACAPPRATSAATPLPRVSATRMAATAVATSPLDGVLANLQPDPTSDYGLVIEDLLSGSRLALNEDRVFPSASVYKLALVWEVLRLADRGRIGLDDPLEITDDDAIEVEPDGGLAPGDTLTVREALEKMVSVSSNAAAHNLLRLIGRDSFNQAMDQLGLTQTRVPEVEDGTEAVTSAEDIALLLRLIAQRRGLSDVSHSALHDMLGQTQWPDALRDTLPDEVLILEKTGNLDHASNVGALLSTERGTVLFVVLDEGVDPGDALSVITQLARAAYDAFLQ